MSNPTTIREYAEWAAYEFDQANLSFGHGTDNAFDEAAYLIAYALELPVDYDNVNVDETLDAKQQQAIRDIIKQRIAKRIPASYLTHEAWFAGLSFYVDERVLVPRSPLAELIEEHFTPWVKPDTVKRVLDIGTGSGCIAIAIAKQLPDVVVDAVDVSEDALAVARINVDKHQVSDRVNLIQSDVYSNLGTQHYDIIISNPPYVDAQDMSALTDEFKAEPALGLAAGPAGLDVVQHILAGASQHLTPDGILIVEVGNSMPAVEQAYPELPLTWLEFERGGHGVFLLDAKHCKGISTQDEH